MIIQSSRHDHIPTFPQQAPQGQFIRISAWLVLDVLLAGVVVEMSSPVWSSALHLMHTRYAKGAGRILACTQIHIYT